MKLYQFEFRKVDIWEEDEKGKLNPVGELDYRQTAKTCLLRPLPGTAGLSGEELEQSLDIWTEMTEANKRGETSVYLDKKQWEYLRDRVNGWKWGIANDAILGFRKYVGKIEPQDIQLKKQEAGES